MQEQELRKGPWLEEEDEQLAGAVAVFGNKKWDSLAKASGLRRSGKSCRLRWMNYLRPNLKHGRISEDEERVIVELHEKLGNKWSKIARRLPGRTDNEIKNYWRGYLKKKAIVQQESCNKTMNTASNISSRTKCRTTKDEILGNSTDDLEQFDLMCSPYETRLRELIMNSPCDTTKTDHANEFCNYDILNTDWVYNDYASNIWDIPLWEG